VRGLALSRDDIVRRSIIMAIMCQGALQFESIELAHLLHFKTAFAAELERLEPLQAQGLVVVDNAGIQVTELGWFFVRGIAMVFDRYLQADRDRTRFSKIL
jgi:oxygen-independent coproporphyrinogen-3 oxidase